jgi:putative ABC transport system permease protein
MGIPLLHGRFFEENDRLGEELVVVIDEIMAKRVFADQEAIGNRLSLQFLGPARVIGVVRHVRHFGLDSDDQAKVREQVYLPFMQLPDPFLPLTSGMSLVVRTTVAPSDVVQAVRREVRGTTQDQVMFGLRTMEQIVSATLARQRFLLVLFATFATLSLSLACIGIYGVLAYLTGQRVPEIGVRMALGASAHQVMWMILRQSLAMICIGVGIGLAGAIVAGRLLQRSVTGMGPAEPTTLAFMVTVLITAALAASFVPARRASRIDPMSALRQD